jgi:PhnB protein
MTRNRSAPWARVVPVLAVADVREAVAWYVDVLGLVEHVRIGEGHRTQLGVDGERAEMIVRERRRDERVAGTTDQVMLRVDDVDTVLDAARSAGADADETSRDWEYGERQAGFIDPFGHGWVLTQTLRDVDPEKWGGVTVVPRR